MEYQQSPPSAFLAPYIKCYWNLETPDTQSGKERIFPDGCPELLFDYGDLFRKYQGEHYLIQPRSSVHGQLETFMELENTGKVGLFGVRFKPEGLKPFVRMGLHEFTGRNVSVEDIWGKAGLELEDRILNAPDMQARIAVIESFLHSRITDAAEEYRQMQFCIHSMGLCKGSISISQLTYDCNLSRRQLERRFTEHIGISPKLLSRIIRFQNTLNMLEQGQFTSLTALAFESGFYDQAHFIRDFRDFTGLNPRQYFAEKLEMAKLLNS